MRQRGSCESCVIGNNFIQHRDGGIKFLLQKRLLLVPRHGAWKEFVNQLSVSRTIVLGFFRGYNIIEMGKTCKGKLYSKLFSVLCADRHISVVSKAELGSILDTVFDTELGDSKVLTAYMETILDPLTKKAKDKKGKIELQGRGDRYYKKLDAAKKEAGSKEAPLYAKPVAEIADSLTDYVKVAIGLYATGEKENWDSVSTLVDMATAQPFVEAELDYLPEKTGLQDAFKFLQPKKNPAQEEPKPELPSECFDKKRMFNIMLTWMLFLKACQGEGVILKEGGK